MSDRFLKAMQKKSTSSQTGKLKIGKKEEVLRRKHELLETLPTATITLSRLSYRSKYILRIFRNLLAVNIIFSITIIFISAVYAVYFNDCITMTLGQVITFATKLFFASIVTKTLFLSMFGLIASTWNIEKFMTLYIKMAMFLLAMTALFAIWFILHRRYEIDFSVFKAKTICTQEEAKCWGYIQKTFHCCGWTGPDYWKEVPLTCCNKRLEGYKTNCTSKFIPKSFAYTTGCFDKINKYIIIMIGCVSAFCSFKLIILIISIIMANYIMKER